jgi:hypothetical protein
MGAGSKWQRRDGGGGRKGERGMWGMTLRTGVGWGMPAILLAM